MYTKHMLILHIVTALTSVLFTVYLYLAPSNNKLRVSYGLLAGTVGTGTILVISTHAPMLQSCVTGLTFVSISLIGTILAKYKLAKVAVKHN